MMKISSWRSLVTDDLGVDLGTSRTRVFARGRGIVVNEPSLLAYDKNTREVVAVGMEALELEVLIIQRLKKVINQCVCKTVLVKFA